MPNRKYFFDGSDLQYKQVKLAFKDRLIRCIFWIVISIVLSFVYISVFSNYFGSPKEKILNQSIESYKLKFSILDRKLDNARKVINNLKLSDDKRYRPILAMDSIPESFRKAGYGGTDRYGDLAGFMNSNILISIKSSLEEINSMANIQNVSFKADSLRTDEWRRENDYLPKISPVDPSISLGDGIKLREVHPVYGTPKWHFGQDFNAPYGSDVFATGNGTVIAAGWIKNGFGNQIVIDHGYGYQTVYGHLSSIKVADGANVKRGDMIALSGSTGIATGPHLHYEIILNGNHQEPINSFAGDLTHDEYLEMIQFLSSRYKYR
jgi:murein DD-endopeptidase MepM/ murein hydrolase activator NlpD